MSSIKFLLKCLRALDVEEAVVALNGSGDSGDTQFDHWRSRTGEVSYELPSLTIGLHGMTLEALIGNIAADIPEGDWVNNEGGHGTVTFRPFEIDEDLLVECDMTYRTEYEEGEPDFEDDEEEDEAQLIGDPETNDQGPAAGSEIPTIIFLQEAER